MFERFGFSIHRLGASLYMVTGPYFQGFMETAIEAKRIIAGLIAEQCTD